MNRRTGTIFAPPADIVELSDRLLILVEIAGMSAGDFEISLNKRRLTISGRRNRPPLTKPAYHQLEIGFGEFRAKFTLPWSVDQEAVSASYRDGFLQIDLPRRPEKQVPVVDLSTEDTEEQDKPNHD